MSKMSKKGNKQKRYSRGIKINVTLDMREKRLGYRETIWKHWKASKGKEPNYIKQI